MSVRFSFKRSGEMIATPRLTFATSGVSADTRATYLKAINASLDACVPLKFTGGLGGALAGRPIAIRYVDNRELGKQARNRDVRTSALQLLIFVIAGLDPAIHLSSNKLRLFACADDGYAGQARV